MDDISKVLRGESCAKLETLLNEAALYAGFERERKIAMEHLVRAYLRQKYDAANDLGAAEPSEMEEAAYHEAGHAVLVAEALLKKRNCI